MTGRERTCENERYAPGIDYPDVCGKPGYAILRAVPGCPTVCEECLEAFRNHPQPTVRGWAKDAELLTKTATPSRPPTLWEHPASNKEWNRASAIGTAIHQAVEAVTKDHQEQIDKALKKLALARQWLGPHLSPTVNREMALSRINEAEDILNALTAEDA